MVQALLYLYPLPMYGLGMACLEVYHVVTLPSAKQLLTKWLGKRQEQVKCHKDLFDLEY